MSRSNLSNPKYNEEIVSAINKKKGDDSKARFSEVILELRQVLADTYDKNEATSEYKAMWKRRINTVAQDMGVEVYGEFTDTLFRSVINDTVDSTPSPSSLSSPLTKSPLVGNHPSASSSAALLSDADKASIKAMYDSLDVTKMWTLSTGKKVEIQMKQLAMECNYEHLCHSLIMDVDDATWDKYFSEEELIEISKHDRTTTPTLPAELRSCLEAIGHASTAKDAGRLAFSKASEYYDHPSCVWALVAITLAARFYEKSVTGIDFDAISETDLLLRPWHVLSSAFEDSIVDACPGELASQASKAARNQKRTMDSISHKGRSKCGAKVDILYKAGIKELGCVEAGKQQGMGESTKEMKDGWLKQPKTLKDMLYALATRNPQLTRNLSTVGFTVMGSKLVKMVLTAPAGYVSRLAKTKAIFFPGSSNEFPNGIQDILKVIWTGRMMMEANALLSSPSSAVTATTDDLFCTRFSPPETLLRPAFHSSSSSSSSASSASKKAKLATQ